MRQKFSLELIHQWDHPKFRLPKIEEKPGQIKPQQIPINVKTGILRFHGFKIDDDSNFK